MRTVLVLIYVFIAASCATAQKKSGIDNLFGDWTGESQCAGSNRNCHDEIVVYHLTPSTKDASKVNIAADKIVNGKPDPMGDFDCIFDAQKIILTAGFTIPRTGGKGVWSFKINGDKMDGTLTIFPENEVGRNVHVSQKKNDK